MPSSRRDPPTGPADPLIANRQPCVIGGVLVTTRAMRPTRSGASPEWGPQDVDARRDGLQVVGVDALSIATQVINKQAILNGTDQSCVYGPVGVHLSATHCGMAVPAAIKRAGPQPAVTRSVDVPSQPVEDRERSRTFAFVRNVDALGSQP